jgi:hypothetical protein
MISSLISDSGLGIFLHIHRGFDIALINRNAVSMILRAAYGYQLKSIDDVFVNNLEEGFRLTADINTPGKYWVEFLPIRESILQRTTNNSA